MQSPTPLSRATRRKLDRIENKPNKRYEQLSKRLERGVVAKMTRDQKRIDYLNNLPLGAPEHARNVRIVFKNVASVLDELEREGTTNHLDDGTSVLYCEEEQCWFPAAPALIDMCDIFGKLCTVYGWGDDNTAGLRRLAKRIELDMPIFAEDVASARRSLAWMIEHAKTITPLQFNAEAREVQIREEFAAMGI